MSTPMMCVLGAVAGLLSHVHLFVRGEWEKNAPTITAVYTLGSALMFGLLIVARQLPVSDAFATVAVLTASYLTGLFSSIGLYRLFFHPLKKFPGPFAAKLSGFHSVLSSLPNFKFHRHVQLLHQEFGDFVRIRPREISINHVNAIRDIHGPGSTCLKGPFYDLNYPSRSLQMTRDKAFHAKRRRVWDRGFSGKALNGYEPRVLKHCYEFLHQISTTPEEVTVEISRLCKFFGLDVMSDLSFGKSFDMLRNTSYHFILDNMTAMKPLVGFLTCVPWLFILFQNLPIIRSKRADWIKWCGVQIEARQKMGKSRLDLFSYILGDETDAQHPHRGMAITSQGDLVYDSELAIVAGSETTAANLTTVLYLLARHPDKQKALRDEIDSLVPNLSEFSHQKLVGSALLEGCINEGMRLYPPVPSGMQRVTPPEGAMIAGRWIPGETIVSTPTYTLHRDSRYFIEPDRFIPERWSTKPELILHKAAFSPFLTGRYSCAGRPLAMMEMRMLIALLVRSFDFRLANENPADTDIEGLFDKKDGYQDFFTAATPKVSLAFVKRASTPIANRS
ncbi:hypothetical protein FQN57_003482 [Myotisia sp. PD_48]|nr:hypothetical protein FQN57_003482 [Myotisia sp. PD_48]